MNANIIFNNYSKINFEKLKEDEIENVLKNIFKSNLGKYKKSLLKNYGNTDITDIVQCIKNNYIHIYEHNYELEIKENLEESAIYKDISYKLKTKNHKSHLSYWYAYNYFKDKGFDLKKINNTSTYFTLTPLDLKNEEFLQFINEYKTLIKCGEIEGYKILDELMSFDFFWLFPIDIELNKKCYLFKATKEYKDMKYKYIKDCFLKFAENRTI